MSGYGDKPFGLRDVKITNMAGTTQTDLPTARRLRMTPRVKSGELEGDDALLSAVAFEIGADWELEAGGISLEAYAALTGRTVATAGTTPNETTTLTAEGAEAYPYVKLYGKSLGEGNDDIHIKVFKCKVKTLQGGFANGEFYVTQCSGVAIDDGTNGIYDIVQNETAANLPSS